MARPVGQHSSHYSFHPERTAPQRHGTSHAPRAKDNQTQPILQETNEDMVVLLHCGVPNMKIALRKRAEVNSSPPVSQEEDKQKDREPLHLRSSGFTEQKTPEDIVLCSAPSPPGDRLLLLTPPERVYNSSVLYMTCSQKGSDRKKRSK